MNNSNNIVRISANNLFDLTAPSSPPVDLEVDDDELTSTSFVFSWAAPPLEHHNGLIRHYIVRCTELESGVVFQRLSMNSSTLTVLIDSLHPYYSYSCAVAAVTVAEGPFSTSVTVATEQDGTSHRLTQPST